MTGKKHWQGRVFTLVTTFAVLTGGLPVSAQDVVTSDDFMGGSSAFVFKNSRKSNQKKVAFRATSSVSRSRTAKLESVKRITRQTITVARINPKRTKFKEVAPDSIKINSVEFKRKTPQEASVIFAGVGEYYINRGESDKSIEWFRESILLDEKNANAKTGLSEALTRKGDELLTGEKYDLAKLFYDEALKTNPKNGGAYAGLAELYSAKDDVENALKNYEAAFENDADLTEITAPLGVIYFQKGEIAKAENYLQKAVATNPNNAETHFFVGLLRYKQDRDAEAIAAFKRSIELEPNNADAHYFLGEVLDRQKDDKGAIDAYQNAVRINPKYSEAWFDLGAAYFNGNRYPEAATAYQTAVKLKPNHGEAYANLADVYRVMYDEDKTKDGKNLDLAITAYRLAINSIKTDAELYSKLGYVATRRAVTPGYQGYWKTAIENFEKAVSISPDHVGYTNLGWAYYNLAQSKLRERYEAEYRANLPKARDAFIKANTFKPAPKVAAAINLNLGMTLTDMGDFAGSIAALKTANEQQKNWTTAINELGIAYRKNNDLENAVKQFKKVIDLDDKYAVAYYNLAESEFRRNNIKEAKKSYEKLKTLNRPDLAAALEMVTGGNIKK